MTPDELTRCETLAFVSGLYVSCYKQGGVRYFVFADVLARTVKTVCTYRKAKCFAEGVAYGRAASASEILD